MLADGADLYPNNGKIVMQTQQNLELRVKLGWLVQCRTSFSVAKLNGVTNML